MTAPCNWDFIIPDEMCTEWGDLEETVQDAALHLASTFLWAQTGRRFGVCDTEIHPCQDRHAIEQYRVFPVRFSGVRVAQPFLDAGVWRNCGCGPSCCCAPRCRIVLRGPVASVDLVVVDGEVVDTTAYRVDAQQGNYYLVRLDGGCWPTCPGVEDPDSFVVTYGRGKPVPEALKIATSVLACEFGKLIGRKGECRLPGRIRTLTRQGVTVDVEPADPGEGLTGLREVDDVIAVYNPSRRKARPLLLSPDLPEYGDFQIVVEPGS